MDVTFDQQLNERNTFCQAWYDHLPGHIRHSGNFSHHALDTIIILLVYNTDTVVHCKVVLTDAHHTYLLLLYIYIYRYLCRLMLSSSYPSFSGLSSLFLPPHCFCLSLLSGDKKDICSIVVLSPDNKLKQKQCGGRNNSGVRFVFYTTFSPILIMIYTIYYK